MYVTDYENSDEPIKLPINACHKATALFQLQAGAKGYFSVPFVKGDHIVKSPMVFSALKRSHQKHVGGQTIVFVHQTVNTGKACPVITHRVSFFCRIGWRFAQLLFLAFTKLSCDKLLLLNIQFMTFSLRKPRFLF